ncbi:winged helix-turn-helix transcriptional regulator [Candidatus Woesearchaeota archaeon]|jgi:predicted transcriptional regulator|nr:winged helix-turn-helix transcriptional regulator [Candidatus Woesearchaeota archaeon]MBT4321970.1 winged helix-turn-helix transcriptional regulator [Candidatus Woesearchaeota archaeon]MBT4631322.1 winged helix-turn-helix transcriptional regulator [Candidatus Woesearchaeota archaeon]
MKKRSKFEIMKDILQTVQNNPDIKTTPLLRKSNLSTLRFKQYYEDLLKKELIKETENKGKFVNLTEKGFRFLDKYKTILNFIDEFDL